MRHIFSPIHAGSASYYLHLAFGVIFVVSILALLQAAPRQYRKSIIAFFTFLGGLYYVAEFFIPADKKTGENFLTPLNGVVANVSTVFQAWAIGLGVISLMHLHFRNVARARPGWGNSIALIVSFAVMTVFSMLNQYNPAGHLWTFYGARVTNSKVFDFLFTGGISNFGAAIFSMIAFFIASAAYRAFRIRSLESSFLMTSALIVMLGSVSFGTMMTNSLPIGTDPRSEFWANFRIENVAQWLLLQVNTPAQRGILFGLTLGSLAMSLRIWLSLERGAYFDKEI